MYLPIGTPEAHKQHAFISCITKNSNSGIPSILCMQKNRASSATIYVLPDRFFPSGIATTEEVTLFKRLLKSQIRLLSINVIISSVLQRYCILFL
jgi:hypothetical protein